MKPGHTRSLRRDRRGSVSLELALIATLFLIPLTIATWDGVFLLTARIHLNASFGTLARFAWTDPADAVNLNDLNQLLTALDTGSTTTIAFPFGVTPLLSYACQQSDGSMTPASEQTSASTGATTEICTTGTLATNVTYNLTTTVDLPFPLPFLPSPMTLSVDNQIRVE